MGELALTERNEAQPSINLKYIKEESTPGCYIKARYVLAVIQFFGMINLAVLRNNITVAIVAMVAVVPSIVAVNSTSSCPSIKERSSTKNGTFSWNSAEQGLILGCYYYGYVASNLPGAWLSKRFGMKYTVGIMTLIASVLTVCTPFVAYFSFILLVIVRILIGLLQGVVSPSVIGSWGVWGPPSERNAFVSVALSGFSVGTFFNLIFSGIIAKRLGWQAVFYITATYGFGAAESTGWDSFEYRRLLRNNYFYKFVKGAGGVVWSLIWIILVHDYPEKHPRISEQEKDYIQQTTRRVNQCNEKFDGSSPPWKSVATSFPLWAICSALFSSNWGNFVLMAMLPTYMANVLNFDIVSSGYLSALAYIIRTLFIAVAGFATSLAQNKTEIPIGALRRINQTASLLINGLFLVLVGYVGCNATAAVAFFCVAAGANAFTTNGCVPNTMDIAPSYGKLMFGICNTIGNLSGFVTPQIIGFILLGSNSIGRWQIVFWMSAGVEVCGAVFYLIFASGEEQEWAKFKLENQEIRSVLLK